MLTKLLETIRPLDENAMESARLHWDAIAKPLHSLGRLEDMIVQLAGICENPVPAPRKKAVLIFCADNGIVAEGVTQTTQDVTAAVTQKLCQRNCIRQCAVPYLRHRGIPGGYRRCTGAGLPRCAEPQGRLRHAELCPRSCHAPG